MSCDTGKIPYPSHRMPLFGSCVERPLHEIQSTTVRLSLPQIPHIPSPDLISVLRHKPTNQGYDCGVSLCSIDICLSAALCQRHKQNQKTISIKTDRMNLLFTMTNNPRHSTFPMKRRGSNLLFLPDEKDSQMFHWPGPQGAP